MNYYGQHSQSNLGFVDQITHWCREWLQNTNGVNKQAMGQWIETKGASQIANRLATVNPNPQANFAKQFVFSELSNVSLQFGIGGGYQQQQPMIQNSSPIGTYGGAINSNTTPTQTYSPVEHEPEPEEDINIYNSPRKDSEQEYTVPGSLGRLTLYISEDESRFSHLKLDTSIAFGNECDLIDYLTDIKPPGRCIIQVNHQQLKRFKIPSTQFKEVVKSINVMMRNTALLQSMSDVELFEAYNDCLATIPAGMVNKMTSVVLGIVNQYTRAKFLQSSENIGPTVMLSQSKDIYALLTNDISLEKFKSVHGYNGRIRAVMHAVLDTVSKVLVDDGTEFGEESPWLTMCGNLALADKSGLVKSAYLSPDRDHINVQKELAEKYTVIGIPTTSFVVFDTPKKHSAFASIVKSKGSQLVESPSDDIEFIICSESAGLLLSDIVLIDGLYPYPQHFTHGETIDHVSVITKW